LSLSLSSEEITRSLRFIDLVVWSFDRLKSGRTLTLDSLWFPNKKNLFERDPFLKGYTFDQLRQAFRELEDFRPPTQPLMALVSRTDSESYEITQRGSETTAADLMHQLLKPQYDETKKAAHRYFVRARLIPAAGGLVALAFGLVLLWLETEMPLISAGRAAVQSLSHAAALLGFGGGLFFAFTFVIFGQAYRISNERALVIVLWEAYSAYKQFLANKEKASLEMARKLVKAASRQLRRITGERPTFWTSLCIEREKVWKIGQELRARVPPLIGDEGMPEGIGEVLVRLVRFFLEGSSDAVRDALQLLEGLSAPPVAVPTRWETFASTVRTQGIARRLFVLGISGAVVISIYLFFAWANGWPLLPKPDSAIGILVGILTVGLFLETILLR